MIKNKDKLIALLKALYPNIKIILFGSRARGDFKDNSDIDIALDIGRKISVLELAQIQNIIDALNIPQKVDLADLHRIPLELKENIMKEGILWID